MYRHPRDELVDVMSRMYGRHLTTSSGGNASIVDAEDVIWMTPKGNDKGALTRDEIAFRRAGDTKWQGNFPPSSEWPFHTRIYEERPDIRAILHAHSQTLVAFSVANMTPNTFVLSQAARLCGPVAIASYAMPGSDALAESIICHIKDHDCVILANHGVVVVGTTILQAYQKFEALEFCARAQARARVLARQCLTLSKEDLELQSSAMSDLQVSQSRPPVSTAECELRHSLVKFVRRAYEQGLFHSTSGAMSAKLSNTSFLITPSGVDRRSIEVEDIVFVEFPSVADAQAGTRAHFYNEGKGWLPSRAWAVHNAIYQAYPAAQVVVHAHPIHISSFCITTVPFIPHVIPESYIVLRSVGRISFHASSRGDDVVKGFENAGQDCNVVLVENDGVVVKGSTLAQAFDRLEVLEATANVVIECKSLGSFTPMTHEQKIEIDEKWFAL